MYIDAVITDFRAKLVEPLFADITRTLEVTCHKSGKENHGSNFVGNAAVLSGIETLVQFIDPNSEEKHRAFRKQAEEHYNKLDKATQNYVAPKPGPRDGSKFATAFSERRSLGFHSTN